MYFFNVFIHSTFVVHLCWFLYQWFCYFLLPGCILWIYHSLSIFLLLDVWVVPILWLFWTQLLWIHVTSPSVDMFTFIWNKHLRMEFLVHRVTFCVPLYETAVFPEWLCHWLLPAMYEASSTWDSWELHSGELQQGREHGGVSRLKATLSCGLFLFLFPLPFPLGQHHPPHTRSAPSHF